jgi:signal transduction histidine kinase
MGKELEFNDLEVSRKNSQLFAVIRTLESDRKRIAQDLHDDISSKLNVVSLNCHLLNTPNLSSGEIAEITKTIIDYTAKALASSRKITHSLLPPVLERFGLHAGIEELVADVNSNEAVVVEYESKIKFDFKENEKHIHVFRILQELTNNSIHHGKASAISIIFDEIKDKKTCKYSDNGIGFDMQDIMDFSGLGLKNIESRVAILDGALVLESELNKGMSVIFNF